MHARNLVLFYFLATFPLAYVWRDFNLEKFKLDKKFLTGIFLLLVAANTLMAVFFLQEAPEKIYLPLKILFFAAVLFALYNLLVLKVEGRILHPTILPRKILSLLASLFVFSGIFLVTIAAAEPKPDQTYTEAIKFLLRTERPENISLYAGQGTGGLAGSFGIKYYIDSRSEVFIKENNGQKNIFEEYLDFTGGRIYYKDFFNRYDFTHIILTSEQPFLFNRLSEDKNFRVIYESERADGSKVIRCKIFVPPRKD